ncbi:MAG: M23 family metallopeptidase [Chloroflexi bacterium]|nr:M23 family metallopeptidase [Chloroflexota bacterium]
MVAAGQHAGGPVTPVVHGAAAVREPAVDGGALRRDGRPDALRVGRREAKRAIRTAIRSALAGVALSLLVVSAVLAADYAVVPGDTLNGIAVRHGSTAAAFIRANNLVDGDLILVGQTLTIPTVSVPYGLSEPSATGRLPLRGGAVWPLEGPITTYFGEVGSFWRRGWHPGLDIGATIGTPVVAARPGTVTVAEATGYNNGYGSYVRIDHGEGLSTLYAHLARVLVSVGDTVLVGQPIGTVGMTGFTTGPHLHFEVRQGDEVQDPLRYLPR